MSNNKLVENMEILKTSVIALEKLTTVYKDLMDVQNGSGMGKDVGDKVTHKTILEQNLVLQKQCNDLIEQKIREIAK